MGKVYRYICDSNKQRNNKHSQNMKEHYIKNGKVTFYAYLNKI